MESWPAGTSPICGIWCMWEDRPSFKDRFLMIDRSAWRSSPGMVFPGLPNESQRKSRPEKDPLMKRKVTSNALHFYLLWSTGSSRFFLDYLWAVDQEEEEEHNMKRHREFFRAVERSWFHWRSERIDDQQTIREGLMVSLENWFGESERLTVYSRIILWVQPPVKELPTFPFPWFLLLGCNRQAQDQRNQDGKDEWMLDLDGISLQTASVESFLGIPSIGPRMI